MDNIKFFQMETGKSYNTVVMVLSVGQEKMASNGKPYVPVEITDGQKSKKTNLFDYTKEQLGEKGLIEGAIINTSMKLTKADNSDAVYCNIDSWEINIDPKITKADFIKVAPINLDKAFNWLLERLDALIAESEDKDDSPYDSVAYLTKNILLENKENFMYSSAAVSMHHNFVGGLIYHTSRMVSYAYDTCRTYALLNKELLVCGAILHDIGKVVSMETSEVGAAKYTVEGNLFEHAIIGYDMIGIMANNDIEHNYDPEKIMALKHMIISHHGKLEWGASVTPKTPEATALHIIDYMDSRMNMFEEAYVGQECGTMSADKVYGLENSFVYKPKY